MDREWQAICMWGQQKQQQKKEDKLVHNDGLEVRSSISQHIYSQLLKTSLTRRTIDSHLAVRTRVNKIITMETLLSTSHKGPKLFGSEASEKENSSNT